MFCNKFCGSRLSLKWALALAIAHIVLALILATSNDNARADDVTVGAPAVPISMSTIDSEAES